MDVSSHDAAMGANRVNLKNVPIGAWILLSTGFVSMVAAIVILSVNGSDTTEFYRFLNQAGNWVGILLGGGGMVYGAAAARNAQQAAEQTNGTLDDRIEEAVVRAMSKRGVGE